MTRGLSLIAHRRQTLARPVSTGRGGKTCDCPECERAMSVVTATIAPQSLLERLRKEVRRA